MRTLRLKIYGISAMVTVPALTTAGLMTAVLITLLLLSTGCERRPPPTRGEVAGVADAYQQSHQLSWGDPVEVLPPPTAGDTDGHRWWQLRYAPGADGSPRLLIVDDHSLWVRVPPAGFRLRLANRPGAANGVVPQVPLVRADPGTWIVLVTTPVVLDSEAQSLRERQVITLNAQAGRDGLLPLFSLRTDRAGRSAVVYGWQGDSGIARDERLREWITRVMADHISTWVDLSGEQ